MFDAFTIENRWRIVTRSTLDNLMYGSVRYSDGMEIEIDDLGNILTAMGRDDACRVEISSEDSFEVRARATLNEDGSWTCSDICWDNGSKTIEGGALEAMEALYELIGDE